MRHAMYSYRNTYILISVFLQLDRRSTAKTPGTIHLVAVRETIDSIARGNMTCSDEM